MKSSKKKNIISTKLMGYILAGVLGWVVCYLGEVADSFFAGVALNNIAVAAIEVVVPFYTIITVFGVLLAEGTAIKYSTEKGKGNIKKANQIFTTSFLIGILTGIVLALVMYFFKEPLLRVFTESEEMFDYCVKYYEPHILIALIYPSYYVLYRILSADGDVNFCVLVDGVGAVTNLVVCFATINALGIQGLGLGTLLTIVISLLMCALKLFLKKDGPRLAFKGNAKDFGWCLSVGMPTAFATLLVAVLDLILSRYILVRFGEAFVAVYGVVNLVTYAAMIISSVGSGACDMLSNANGEVNNEEVKEIKKNLFKYTIILGLVLTVILCALSPVLPGLYDLDHDEYYGYAVWTTISVACTYVVLGLNYSLTYYYEAFGNRIIPSLITVVDQFIAPLVLSMSISAIMKDYAGILIGFAISPIVTFSVTLIYIRIKYGKENFPLMGIKTDEKQFIYFLSLNKDEIIDTRNKVQAVLKENNISEKAIMQAMMTIEDTFMVIIEKNPNKKLLGECFVSIAKNKVRIILKDNGIAYKIHDDGAIDSFNKFVLDSISARNIRNYSAIKLNMNVNSVEIAR